MASSDDEQEVIPETVTEYYFVDEEDGPICFSVLPVQWEEGESLDTAKNQVFLHGKTDDGLRKFFQQVIAWKVEIQGKHPEVWVLPKGKKWIKLLKPRKSFDDTIRKISVTLRCLHYLKRSPEASEKSLWDHVRKVFSQFDIKASEYDLLDHLPFIHCMVKRDEVLSKSQLLRKFLDELPKRKASSELLKWDHQSDPNLDFLNDNDEDDEDEGTGNGEGDDSDTEGDCFDSVCAFCDNGGDLLCCEGRCLRSFHATKDSGRDSHCKSLGFTRAKVDAIQNFLCPNCQHKQHQCFICGKLGSSDKASAAEVFPCVSATCGYFYHPHCVARLLHPENEAEATKEERQIASGESFTCPVHYCVQCKQVENKEVKDLQFAMCRRCPRSYHRKCMPRKILFEDKEDENMLQRAWDGLIPNRILIYCLRHKINENIGTPTRNHIIFPETVEKKKLHPDSGKVKAFLKREAEDLSREKTSIKGSKAVEKASSGVEEGDFVKTSEKTIPGQVVNSFKKPKTSDTLKFFSRDSVKLKADKYLSEEEKKISTRDEKAVPKKDLPSGKVERVVSPTSVGKKSSSSLPIDSEARKRIMLLIQNSHSCSLTLEDFVKKKDVPSTHAYSARHVDKSITLGKVERSVEAIRTALQKLESGRSIQDARAVCGPDILNQMLKWRNKFKVYLAPFLHGMRYTSFGRHFTKVDKLKEIVEKLHCYVQNGDMIVDFCCGANDFSLLMKEKLEATGKKCSFRNYDVIQPKNDFNFVKKDWMKVRQKELLTGSQLIMGLNPPFGVKAALANKFIDKALEFKPKLLILIVPSETVRLDEKKAAYDLIWEDGEELSGKSFYLPGSVDVNDKQMEQWNLKPPLLYLWSRPDWTAKHKSIALRHDHTSKVHEKSVVVENGKKPHAADHQILEDHNLYGNISEIPHDMPEEQNGEAEGSKENAGPDVDKVALPASDKRAGSSRHENVINRKESRNYAVHNGRTTSREKPKKNFHKRKRKDEPLGCRDDGELSDMSISPPHNMDPVNLVDRHCPLETSTGRATSSGGFHLSGSGLGMTHGVVRSSSLPRENIDDIEKRYTPPSWELRFLSSPQDFSTRGVDGHSFGIRGLEERPSGYIRDNVLDSFDRKPHIVEDRSSRQDIYTQIRMYGQQDPDERSSSGPDIHTQIQMFGQQDPDDSQRSRYSLGGASSGLGRVGSISLPYGFSNPTIGSSAMQRYAPRLDELNYVRRGPSVTNHTSLLPGGDGGMFGMPGSPNMPGSRAGFPHDPAVFPPGPRHPYPHHGSCGGWLDE